jgi:hypothetical protein
VNLEGKWPAILIGGLIIGLGTLVPILNLACCLIPLLGAIVSVAVYANSAQRPAVTSNDGLALGLMSGLVGTAIFALVAIPAALLVGSAIGGVLGGLVPDLSDMPANVARVLERLFANFGNVLALVVFARVLGQLALSLVFGVLGGLVGAAVFKRQG